MKYPERFNLQTQEVDQAVGMEQGVAAVSLHFLSGVMGCSKIMADNSDGCTALNVHMFTELH